MISTERVLEQRQERHRAGETTRLERLLAEGSEAKARAEEKRRRRAARGSGFAPASFRETRLAVAVPQAAAVPSAHPGLSRRAQAAALLAAMAASPGPILVEGELAQAIADRRRELDRTLEDPDLPAAVEDALREAGLVVPPPPPDLLA